MYQECCKFNNPFNIPQVSQTYFVHDYTVLYVPSNKCHHHHPSQKSLLPLSYSSSSSQFLNPIYSRTNSESGSKEHLTSVSSLCWTDTVLQHLFPILKAETSFTHFVGMANKHPYPDLPQCQ